MLARENRLKKEKEFEKVFKEGKGRRGRFLFVKYLLKENGVSRFGFVVSKKVSKKAVKRNKIKRRMREAARPFLFLLRQPVDCIVVALPKARNASWKDIKKDVTDFFNKTNLLKNKR